MLKAVKYGYFFAALYIFYRKKEVVRIDVFMLPLGTFGKPTIYYNSRCIFLNFKRKKVNWKVNFFKLNAKLLLKIRSEFDGK
jgi:hypothetical protein